MAGYLDFIDPGNSGGSIQIPEMERTPLRKPVYVCTKCGNSFNSDENRRAHIFEKHPFHRPALLLDGDEPVGPRATLRQPLSAGDIAANDFRSILLDGKSVSASYLADVLARERQGYHMVVLEGQGRPVEYRLDFDIADPKDLDQVDNVFRGLVKGGVLNRMQIDSFIRLTQAYTSGVSYVEGICHYLWGVLAKDQSGDTGLERHEYESRFNLAIAALHGHGRPLPEVINAIVHFNFNAFGHMAGARYAPGLAMAAQRIAGVAIDTVGGKASGRVDAGIPLDAATHRLLDYAARLDVLSADDLREMEAVRRESSWVPADKAKISVLLAEGHLKQGDEAAARALARRLHNDPIFGGWAGNLIKRIEK